MQPDCACAHARVQAEVGRFGSGRDRLQLEPQEVYPHFSRILQGIERTPQEYLGETTFQAYYNTFIKPERTSDEIEPELEPFDLE